MSRIGKSPIALPSGVNVSISPGRVMVNGPLGELSQQLPQRIAVEQQEDQIVVTRPTERGEDRALHGLTRSLVANMVEGVTKGFEKTLEIQGVGYRASLRGTSLELNVGFSHPVSVNPPQGITFDVPQPTVVIVKGIDKQQVGQIASEIRRVRPPEPYKGKGIRYQGEYVPASSGSAPDGHTLTTRAGPPARPPAAQARLASNDVVGASAERPRRLVVFRSNRGIEAQLVDDLSGKTIAGANHLGVKKSFKGSKTDQAAEVGKLLAQAAKKAGVETVVFDRGGYLYHGRVKALAEGAREGGLVF